MEDAEIATEHLHEKIAESAEKHGGWMTYCALLSALLAVFAAITGLQSSFYANEAMRLQIESSDTWNYYQAKGIKAEIAGLMPARADTVAKIARYKQEQEATKKDAEAKTAQSKRALDRHEGLASAVTMFQVAIAMSAIAALTRRRRFMFFSAALCAGGVIFWILSALEKL